MTTPMLASGHRSLKHQEFRVPGLERESVLGDASNFSIFLYPITLDYDFVWHCRLEATGKWQMYANFLQSPA